MASDVVWTFVRDIAASVIYSALGILMFGVGFLVIRAVVPFSLRKEIEEDQNTALAILIGAVILGLSIVIAAAIG